VAVALNGLAAGDVTVELLVACGAHLAPADARSVLPLAPVGNADAAGVQRYELQFVPESCGRFDYRIRAYPRHPALAHPFELGLMLWL
jgi:starch phosphorylase